MDPLYGTDASNQQIDWSQYTGTGMFTDNSTTGTDSATQVGPQSDGTYAAAPAATPSNTPWGVGGTTQGNYGQQVLDVMKFGVGVWQQQNAQNAFYDYKRYEATAGGLFMQGRPIGGYSTAIAPTRNGALLIGLALAVLVLASHHG